jgi:O-antigen ligase
MTDKYHKWIFNIFFTLVCLALTSPLWVSKELLFPYVTTKAFVLRIAIELALPFYIYFLLSKPEDRPNLKRPINFCVIGFVLTTWLSAFFGDNILKSVFGNFERMGGAFYVTHLALLYFYIHFLGQVSSKYLFRILQFFIFTSFIICANGVVGWLGGPTLVLDPSLPGRASSTLGNPIYLGAFAIVPMFLCFYFLLNQSKTQSKIIYGILGGLFLVAMLQSGTRGALVGVLLGLAMGVILYIFLNTSRALRQKGIIFIVICSGFFGYLFWQPQVLPKGSTIRRVFELRDTNTSSRIIQWQTALRGFKDYPLLGVGPENYYVISNKYYNPESYKYDRSWFDKPHNYPLEILVTGGIINFIFYVSLICLMLKILFNAYKQDFLSLLEFCVLVSGLIAYLGQNMFVFDTVPTSVAFYTMLGFVGVLDVFTNQRLKPAQISQPFVPAFRVSVVSVCLLFTVYCCYYLNWLPLLASRWSNYGLAYASANLEISHQYFTKVINNQFNFDVSESASKYADALLPVLTPEVVAKLDKNKLIGYLKSLEAYLDLATNRSPYDPILFQKLASVFILCSIL